MIVVMTDTRRPETDPSVCYRHPGRQSWVLCQRCGRTVCPECQILAPVGVHCPECVRETQGGMSWRPANAAPPKPKRRRSPGRARSLVMARAADGTPVVTYTLIGANLVTLVLAYIPAARAALGYLVALPGTEIQVWRYLTAALVSGGLLNFLLGGLFLYLSGPQLERMLGTGKFLAIVSVATVAGSAAALLSGGSNLGLTGPLFGVFAALLVTVWHDERMRVQIFVMLGINAVLAIVTGGPSALALLVGALLGGAGTTYVLRTAPDRGWKRNTPALLIGGCTLGLVVLTVLKSLVAG